MLSLGLELLYISSDPAGMSTERTSEFLMMIRLKGLWWECDFLTAIWRIIEIEKKINTVYNISRSALVNFWLR